jgi:very-short-patch-repair endonuclease
MRTELLADVAAAGGVVSRDRALTMAATHVVDDAVRAGCLVPVLNGVYGLADVPRDRLFWRRAALAHVPGSALSHVDALDVWGLPVPAHVLAMPPVHISKGRGWTATDPRVKTHRRAGFAAMPLFEVGRHRLVAVSPEQAAVESWALLPTLDRASPVIVGLRDRNLGPQRLLGVLQKNPRAAGARELRRIVGLVADGCHSELELWGHRHVFSDRRLPRSQRQHPVRVGRQRFFLDRYFEEEMLGVELDGAAYHGRPGQRERDLRRDAALATLGIQTLRFSHPRLHGDRDGVVEEILAVLAVRRRQLGLS